VRASLILVLVGFAGVAEAVDLDLSMTTTVGYDDNIFRTDKDKEDDVSFRFGPAVRVRDETSKLSYNVSYNPVYEQFVTWTEADDWAHFAHGSVDYQLSDRTLLSLSDNFRFVQSLNRGPLVANQDASGNDIDFVPETDVEREDIYRNTAIASVLHNISAHTQAEFKIKYDFFDSERRNTSKNNSVSGFANVMHALSARDQVGLGGGATWQRFDDVRGQPQSDTFIFQLAGSWIHNISQDTELTLRAGPAVIYTDQNAARTGSEDQYPHFVANGATIGAAYDALGLNLPVDVQDLNGNKLSAGDPLGANSVLIPEDTDCLQGMVRGQTVFDRSNCSFNVVVDSTTFGTVAGAIRNAPKANLSFMAGDIGGSDTRVTAFGEFNLSHYWFPELSSRASYTRSDSMANSFGSSTISDHAMFETVWTPTRRWDLQVRGDWLQRKSATKTSNTFLVIDTATDLGGGVVSPTPIISSTGLITDSFNETIDTEYWRVSGRAAYRTSRRSTVSLRASYQHQDTKRGATRGNSSFENFLVILGFRYDLDPFHF
jgi:hypothetical protein